MPFRFFLTLAIAIASLLAISEISADDFSTASSWTTFNAAENGVGTNPVGFHGAAFDGRYIYFVPFLRLEEQHGEVLRYDTQSEFDSVSSWSSFDPSSSGVGTRPKGFHGAVFDGQYVYFVPFNNGAGLNGEVLRYDTSGDFENASSWSTYDPGSNGVGVDPDGYHGAVFDGQYVYFVPFHNGTNEHGEFLRLNTQGSFSSASSWEAYDPGANGVGTDPDGYRGGVYDGQYIYFAPHHNGTSNHGEVLRYNTSGTFNSASSWSAYDPGANGVGFDPDGYHGAVFDGQYVYFVPYYDGIEQHGEVLRYDTSGDFASASSWVSFDPSKNGIGNDADGYHDAVYDGRYIYLAPYNNGSEQHGEVLRYDTEGSFTSASSWSTYDPGDNGVGNDPDGFNGVITDSIFIYFIPYFNGVEHDCEVLRFGVSSLSYICGDANASGEVDIDDIIYIVGYIFASGPEPNPMESGDVNCSGFVDIDDVIFLIGYIFASGPWPCDTDGDGTPDC